MKHNGAKSYVVTMYMNEPLHFTEGGMEHTINKFLSFVPMAAAVIKHANMMPTWYSISAISIARCI